MRKIPKIIHYCWFGRGSKPELVSKCINSWKKYCPDYEIKEWNEDNFDISICQYVKQAYDLKKWAFVSDYARFYILFNEGGIYLDTDVELLQPLDQLIENGPFMGLEKDFENNGFCAVAAGLGMASYKNHHLYLEVLNYYNSISFIDQNGDTNMTTVVTHVTNLLKRYGLKDIPGIQCIEGINIYPREYFCPKDVDTYELKVTEKTISIHHYDSSWGEWYDRKVGPRGIKLKKIFGKKLGLKINGFIYVYQKYGFIYIFKKYLEKEIKNDKS